MRVTTVIVNYRTAQMTLKALDALMNEIEPIEGARVIIVDNDSGDGSYQALQEGVKARSLDHRVDVLQSGRNGGFAFGVNAGIRRAMQDSTPPDAIYLLNSDAFPDAGSVGTMAAFMADNPRVSILGSFVHGTDGGPHCTSFRFPTIPGEIVGNLKPGRLLPFLARHEIPLHELDEAARVDWVAGASMLIRRSVFDRIGLFDEGYFLYYEETDFCRRAANEGLETWYCPSASVTHIGSASTGFQDVRKPRASYWFESRSRYFRCHHGFAYLLLSNLVWIPTYLLWRLRVRLQGLPDQDPPRLLRDFIQHALRSLRTPNPEPKGIAFSLYGSAEPEHH